MPRQLLYADEQPSRKCMPGKDRRWQDVPADLFRKLSEAGQGKIDWPLFISGPSGIGKSCAALVLADHSTSAGYAFAQSLPSIRIEDRDKWSGLIRRKLLIVDELARSTEEVSPIHRTSLQLLLDEREGEGNVANIFIANALPDKVYEIYGEKLESRMCSGTLLVSTGEDRRFSCGQHNAKK